MNTIMDMTHPCLSLVGAHTRADSQIARTSVSLTYSSQGGLSLKRSGSHTLPSSSDHSGGTINIRPATSVYATYQRLSYKPWYALAEFVDNSTASYLAHRKQLHQALKITNTKSPSCRIQIDYDHAARRLTIFDTAYGMELSDFTRAIVLDQPPEVRSGRNEFGMGLKTAACWFGLRWTVESTQLGSPTLYRATVDVRDLAETRREQIRYTTRRISPDEHWTRVTIDDVQQLIRGPQHERIREQLRSIYRHDLRSGEIEIWYQGQPLSYEEPELLTEQTPEGLKVWREDIRLEVPWERKGKTLAVTGWVGIRKTMSRRDSGFVLLRRGRVVVGGPEQGYRPDKIVGTAQTHEYGRIVGELHLDEWPVTQAKDAFDWNDGLEDELIDALAHACREVVRKARKHRLDRTPPEPSTNEDMHAAAEPIRHVLETPEFQEFAKNELKAPSAPTGPDPSNSTSEEVSTPPNPAVEKPTVAQADLREQLVLPGVVEQEPIEYLLDMAPDKWLLRLRWQQSDPDQYWMSLSQPRPADHSEPVGAKIVEISLNMAHPFLAPYLHSRSSLDVLQRLVFSLALAETIVGIQNIGGKVDPWMIRTKMNEVLKYAAQAEED